MNGLHIRLRRSWRLLLDWYVPARKEVHTIILLPYGFDFGIVEGSHIVGCRQSRGGGVTPAERVIRDVPPRLLPDRGLPPVTYIGAHPLPVLVHSLEAGVTGFIQKLPNLGMTHPWVQSITLKTVCKLIFHVVIVIAEMLSPPTLRVIGIGSGN